ncbi:hypothetical protein Ahy_B10g101697 [Arachis hypogaea]|uniref:Aminotransferase-like plant mobile domain-containing protein n=1 Tax=Arachis hypogaea TaxID=3818 RepID=A0A444X047_ARAHY|nr:hypothetical protein Ahy_B10g101697 [Arachis hypogaea]
MDLIYPIMEAHVDRPDERIKEYLRWAGFEYVAYMVAWDHNWPLVSALMERWRSESHTFTCHVMR